MELLFFPFALLVAVPGGGFVPTVALGVWVRGRWPRMSRPRRVVAGSAVGLWALYAAYETGMYFWMKTVVAPIRVDLLLIAPVLLAATVAGVAAGWGRGLRATRS